MKVREFIETLEHTGMTDSELLDCELLINDNGNVRSIGTVFLKGKWVAVYLVENESTMVGVSRK